MSANSGTAERENNSPGGVSMFRDIDQSGALYPPQYQFPIADAPVTSLEDWFSSARLARYTGSSNPSTLYVWNQRISKAFLEDVGHVEVLLRNFINLRLIRDSGRQDWYHDQNRYHFNGPFRHSVEKAERRLRGRGRSVTPNQIVAELSFDNWRFLLTQRHEVTIWKALIDPANGGMPYYRGRRREVFEADVELICKLRNRASHQEPLIQSATPTQEESTLLDAYGTALDNTARRIAPEAANWIQANSRVRALRMQRPM